jgi:hypothetical protein
VVLVEIEGVGQGQSLSQRGDQRTERRICHELHGGSGPQRPEIGDRPHRPEHGRQTGHDALISSGKDLELAALGLWNAAQHGGVDGVHAVGQASRYISYRGGPDC